MVDVVIGDGNLAGKGLYAGRDFVAGESVVSYELHPLEEADFLALPAGEELFVHSFGGRRYLFPPPARFANHSDKPSCVQDFDGCQDVALRAIAKGEPITIDATQETTRELTSFLDAYDEALRSRSAPLLGELIDGGAVLWRLGEAAPGRDALVAALLECQPTPLSAVEWFVGTGRWEAVCSVQTQAGDRPQHLTMLLKGRPRKLAAGLPAPWLSSRPWR